jgi:hypothetical protein
MSRSSVLEALRKQHAEVSGDRDPLYLDDPVHDGVVYRYRYVPAQETKGSSKRLSKVKDPTDQAILSAVETILISIEEIMIVTPDGEIPLAEDGTKLYPLPLAPLADNDEPAIKFDECLCHALGFPAGTEQSARKIVREMFAKNDYLIIEHAQEIGEWAASTGSRVREEFAEEIAKGQ